MLSLLFSAIVHTKLASPRSKWWPRTEGHPKNSNLHFTSPTIAQLSSKLLLQPLSKQRHVRWLDLGLALNEAQLQLISIGSNSNMIVVMYCALQHALFRKGRVQSKGNPDVQNNKHFAGPLHSKQLKVQDIHSRKAGLFAEPDRLGMIGSNLETCYCKLCCFRKVVGIFLKHPPALKFLGQSIGTTTNPRIQRAIEIRRPFYFACSHHHPIATDTIKANMRLEVRNLHSSNPTAEPTSDLRCPAQNKKKRA